MRRARGIDHACPKVDIVTVREGQDQAGKGRPAPADRRTGGMWTDPDLDRTVD